jgi:hypothetical protein
MNGLKEAVSLVLTHVIFIPQNIHNYILTVASLKSSPHRTFMYTGREIRMRAVNFKNTVIPHYCRQTNIFKEKY